MYSREVHNLYLIIFMHFMEKLLLKDIKVFNYKWHNYRCIYFIW